MNRFQHMVLRLVLVSLWMATCHCLVFAEDLPRPLPESRINQTGGEQRHIIIDFDSVDIHLFIKFISELTGKNFVVDKAVQGNVTIISPTRISVDEAYRVFESVLEVHGFTTVESGAVTKILPSARARSQNIEMLSMGKSGRPEDKVVTQLVPLKYTSPADLKKVLAPLVSQTSVIIAHTPSGMLIITETMSNIQKLLGIIEVLDVESKEDEVAVILLENASADTLGKILTTIYQTTRGQAKVDADSPISKSVKVVPYERVNGLILVANSSEMGRIKSLVAMLDKKAQRADGNIHVYYLQNATAAELVKVLNVLPEKQQTKEGAKGKVAAISKDVQIMADEETNALIITASKDEYVVLENVIKKLDIPRRMVYLEALIMEVDVDHTFDFGVEWAAGGEFSDSTGVVATGFSGEDGYGLIEGISSEDPSLPAGFSFGVLKQGIELGGITFPNIGALLRAVRSDSDVNVISTPQILTMDNKQAEISVGETVPYITSQNTTASENDYTNYEYKDVATKLSITPHINQADALRLEIETEVVRIKDSGLTPTTFKRTATTTVILRDRDTVVIGGIIGHDVTESDWKIPFLGDIPLLGWLFKTHTTTDRKTNMFIFISPRIIRNPAQIAAVTLKKEDQIGAILPAVKEELYKDENPEHADRLVKKGFEKLMAGELGYARDFFEQALIIDGENPYALMNMGVIYEKQNRMDEALKMYRAVVATGSEALVEKSSDPAATGKSITELAKEHIERVELGDIPAPLPKQ